VKNTKTSKFFFQLFNDGFLQAHSPNFVSKHRSSLFIKKTDLAPKHNKSMSEDELLLPGITFVMFLVIYRSFNGSVVGSRKEIIAPESNIVTHFSNLLVEITLPFDCVCWMVVMMVAGIKNQLNVRARCDKRHLRVSFATARLESQLTFVLGTITESCVSNFTVAV
jgi:hypothetical protein